VIPPVLCGPAHSFISWVFVFVCPGGYDFAVMTAGPVAADYVAMPSVIHYPLQANAIVFTYNLPTALSGGNVLALRPTTLCQIFRGNITRWNDTAIRTDNPAMTGLATAAADQPIVIPTVSVQTATHYWFSTYCGKVRRRTAQDKHGAMHSIISYLFFHTHAFISILFCACAIFPDRPDLQDTGACCRRSGLPRQQSPLQQFGSDELGRGGYGVQFGHHDVE
jgi:hypothetical protein